MELLLPTFTLHFQPLRHSSLSLSDPTSLSHNLPSNRYPYSRKLSFSYSTSRQYQPTYAENRSLWKPLLAASAKSVPPKPEKKDRLPSDIEVTETNELQSKVRLRVKVPSALCQDCYERVLHEVWKKSKVPGFRPGKEIPENILINYVGKENVRRAAIESVLKRTLPHVMSSVTGRALKDSVRILTPFSDMDKAFSPVEFLSYDVVVDVEPEVKWISENAYKNLKIVVEIHNEISAEEACEAELKRRHKSLGSLRIVIDRGLQMGDTAIVNIFATTIKEDDSIGEKIPSAESQGFNLDTEESDSLLPGFLDSIIGIKRGETKSFSLVFPDSWKQENLRGVDAQFTVECKELFCRDLPELDDSLADKLLPGCSTLAQVREAIFQKCREMEQTAKDQATDNAILDQLCKISEVDIPQSLFEEQGRQLYGARLLEIQATAKLSEEQLASLSSEKAVNEFLEHQWENITNIIKQMLAVGDISKCENLQCSTEEIAKEVENSVAEFKRLNQDHDEDRVKEQVQDILVNAKVLEWLREHADIQYVTR